MPDHRLAKTRRSLPAGYQFGDASLNARMGCPFGLTLTPESRRQLEIWESNRDGRGYSRLEQVIDKETGISIRMLKEFDVVVDAAPAQLDVWMPRSWWETFLKSYKGDQ